MHVKIIQILSVGSLAHANLNGDDCVPSDNGGRIGYHSPGPSDEYLRNCNSPLKRELWRVFKKEDGTAYMMPRPDGVASKMEFCADFYLIKDIEIKEKAQEYGLCDEIYSPDIISRINSMDPADAIAFSTIFHRQLRFVANGKAIEPWVPDVDILAACDYLRNKNDGRASKSFCEEVADRCDATTGSCKVIFISPSREAVSELVPALNEVYGVKNFNDPCSYSKWGATFQYPEDPCMVPLEVEGCTYSTKHYFINDAGDCVQPNCYAVDDNGKQCSGCQNQHLLYSNVLCTLFVLIISLLF